MKTGLWIIRSARREVVVMNLITCDDCGVAEYCWDCFGFKDFFDHHEFCVLSEAERKEENKRAKLRFYFELSKNVAYRTALSLEDKGFNIYQSQEYEINYDKISSNYYRHFRKTPTWTELLSDRLNHSEMLFKYGQLKIQSYMCLSSVAIMKESYGLLQDLLDKVLELMKVAQPQFLHLRYMAATLMIVLERYDVAYNFIKFWLSKTRHNIRHTFGDVSAFEFFEGGPFLTEFTMSNQNKRENIFSALSIDAEKKPILKERQY